MVSKRLWVHWALAFCSMVEGFLLEAPGLGTPPSPISSHRSAQASDENDSDSSSVRFLGRGERAIVRPGVVLVAPPDEFHHYLRQAAVFIYAMGTDDDDVYVIRGVIIDHPTPFTMLEMMAEQGGDASSIACLQNLMYRGGERGDATFMLHCDDTLAKQADQEMIGSTGIFEGGLDYATSNNYVIDPQKVKFFFSYMEFTEAELEEMLENREDPSTQWTSVEVSPDFVLNSELERGEAWARLRNAVREQ